MGLFCVMLADIGANPFQRVPGCMCASIVNGNARALALSSRRQKSQRNRLFCWFMWVPIYASTISGRTFDYTSFFEVNDTELIIIFLTNTIWMNNTS